MFTVRGSLDTIIRGDEDLYESNLTHYFNVVFHHAQNLTKGYHNFRHMFHVVWLCYQAIRFYYGQFSRREARNLLIAAMFHDFDHPGMFGHDDLNIERAIRGLRKYILPEDADHLDDIIAIIRATQFPYPSGMETQTLPLLSQIIRDADMGQAFAMAWVQQVVFGLADEWGKAPIDVLRGQPAFLRSVKFSTDWGEKMFPQSEVDAKIQETEALIALLA